MDAGAKRVAEYSYLPPGTYRFRVRANNSDGLWDDNDVDFGFEVQPPFLADMVVLSSHLVARRGGDHRRGSKGFAPSDAPQTGGRRT